MRKILSTLIIAFSLLSCSDSKIYEDVLTQYEDGNHREVKYYKISKDGSRNYVKESWFYQEGTLHLEGPIVDGKRNGKFKTYHKSGSLMSRGNFVDGIREGKATTYHENGKIKYEGFYKNGKECGIWKFYDEDGKLIKEINRDL